MAKLITLFFILIALQACLLFYGGHCNNLSAGLDGIYGTDDDVCNDVGNNIWEFVTNIDNWNSLTFILAFFGIAAGIGLVGVAAGTVFGFKTDFLLLAMAIPGMITMGVIFVNLANTIRDDLISQVFTGCSLASSCSPANFIVAITVGPLALYYVWTIVEWWRGKDF